MKAILLLLSLMGFWQQNPMPMGLLSSRASLAVRSDVSAELLLDKNQAEKIQASLQKVGDIRVTNVQGGSLPVLDQLDETIKPILTDDQWKRLTQIWIQYEGPFVLQSAPIVADLELSPDTQKEVAKAIGAYRGFWTREIQKVRKTSDLDHIKREAQKTGRKLLGLLSPAQRKKFSEMEGPKFRFQP